MPKKPREFCIYCNDPMIAKSLKRKYCCDRCRANHYNEIKAGKLQEEEELRILNNSFEFLIKSGSTTYSELRDKLKK